jgi:predicted dehydrogenase
MIQNLMIWNRTLKIQANKMKSLIIGMGIGHLYKQVLSNLNIDIVTVDLNVAADYKFYLDAIRDHKKFLSVHICTPNFTHESIARDVANHTRFLFIEKPGVQFESAWLNLVQDFPQTRIMMVKNNMWRSNIDQMRQIYKNSTIINLHWLNENRVPKPGTWFTNKKLSFGGVSRDLLPHLLSLYATIEPNYQKTSWLYRNSWRRWSLADLSNSDYGTVTANGVYDVDDYVELECTMSDKRWHFRTGWRTLKPNDIAIHFHKLPIELGLCPESAYQAMIKAAFDNEANDNFWQSQLQLDCWIHRQINL